jgi:hypothetical protein
MIAAHEPFALSKSGNTEVSCDGSTVPLHPPR